MKTIDHGILRNYLDECGEHLSAMENCLLAIESGGPRVDPAQLNRMLGAARSLQAGADVCGLEAVRDLARAMVRAVEPFAAAAPTARNVTVLLSAIDAMRELLAGPGASREADISAFTRALEGSPAVPAAAPSPARAADRSLRTLVVEDDFTSRLVLHTFLSRRGECHVAVNGREAVAACRDALDTGQRYDLICMDIMMPEMDGREAVRQIRAGEEARGILSTCGARIFMTTAVNDMKEVTHCFQALCDAYLVKPVDLAELSRLMKACDLG
jgi:two-component system chemotaxis response regulator CheY